MLFFIENSLFKNIFGHKFCQPMFKIFVAHFTTNILLNIAKKIFCLPLNKLIYSRNLILRSQKQLINLHVQYTAKHIFLLSFYYLVSFYYLGAIPSQLNWQNFYDNNINYTPHNYFCWGGGYSVFLFSHCPSFYPSICSSIRPVTFWIFLNILKRQ